MRRHVWLELGYWAGCGLLVLGMWMHSAFCGIITAGVLLVVSSVVTAIGEGRAAQRGDQEPKG